MSEAVATDEDQAPPRRHRGRIALLVSLGILVLLALVAVGLVWALQSRLDANIERIPDPFEQLTDRPTHVAEDGEDGDAPVNFLLLGTDSRISAGDPSQWQAGAQRTDAMMLVQLSGDREAVTVMSDRKSTRLNSSHVAISYAVFCLKKKS